MPVNKEQLLFYDAASLCAALALSAALCGRSFRRASELGLAQALQAVGREG